MLCKFLILYFQARVTLATNYWANKRACEILFPILRPGARVVNVSSSMGWLGHLTTETEFTTPGDKVCNGLLLSKYESEAEQK